MICTAALIVAFAALVLVLWGVAVSAFVKFFERNVP